MLDRVGRTLRAGWRAMASSSGLEAGQFHRRLSNFLPAREHINTLVSASGRTALARARYLVRNNAYGKGAVGTYADMLVGDGINPAWIVEGDDAARIEIQKAWITWTDEADAGNISDLEGLQNRIARELFIAGECFVRRRPRLPSDGLSVPLQLQLLPSEMLPIEMNELYVGANPIRQGIEFDFLGRRVAYHFLKTHPGDSTEPIQDGQTTRVPASEVLHLFDPDEVGQIRGMPRLTASIVLLFALDSYDDAELERKRVAALFTAFVRREDPDGNLFEEETRKLEAEGVTSAQVLLEPGKAHVLMPGEDIVTAAPADVGANYEAFQYRQLSRLSASLNLPYSGITGDHSRANYSSERSAQLKIRRGIQREQHGVMVFQFLRPVARWFLDAAVLAGTLKLAGYETDPRPWLKIKWIPPKWEWVDPLKDRQAEVVAVNMGAKSLSDVIEAEGAAPEETFQRIARDQKRMKELGIVLPGSPSEAPPPGGGVSEETKTETKTAAGQTP